MPFGALLRRSKRLFPRPPVYALVLAVKAKPLRGALSRSLDSSERAVDGANVEVVPLESVCKSKN